MFRAFRSRLYPNQAQEQQFLWLCETSRFVYNELLSEQTYKYKQSEAGRADLNVGPVATREGEILCEPELGWLEAKRKRYQRRRSRCQRVPLLDEMANPARDDIPVLLGEDVRGLTEKEYQHYRHDL